MEEEYEELEDDTITMEEEGFLKGWESAQKE